MRLVCLPPPVCVIPTVLGRALSLPSPPYAHTHAPFLFLLLFSFLLCSFFFMFCFFSFVFHPACDLPVRLPSTGCVLSVVLGHALSPPSPPFAHTYTHTRTPFFVFDFLFCFLLCITSLYLLIRAAHYLLGRALHFSRAACSQLDHADRRLWLRCPLSFWSHYSLPTFIFHDLSDVFDRAS